MTMLANDYASVMAWLASLSYASGYKRLARMYFAGVVCCLSTTSSVVIMSGPLPRAARVP